MGDDDAVDKDMVAYGDPIIGEETLLDPDRGPGAIPANPVPSPRPMMPEPSRQCSWLHGNGGPSSWQRATNAKKHRQHSW